MCGRYATTRSAADLSALFEALDQTGAGSGDQGPTSAAPASETHGGERPASATPGGEVRPRYNVAPTDAVPLVRLSARLGARVLSVGRWGLLPHWATDPRVGARMINARAETVATSRAFAAAYATRRALVPVDGWYEWQRLPTGGKQPYFITPADGSVLALAGLWTRWGPQRRLTFSVVTIAADAVVRVVHDRMPLVLPPERWQQWLTAERPSLAPPPARLLDGLELRPVAAAVGNVRNDSPDLVKRIDIGRRPGHPAPTLF